MSGDEHGSDDEEAVSKAAGKLYVDTRGERWPGADSCHPVPTSSPRARRASPSRKQSGKLEKRECDLSLRLRAVLLTLDATECHTPRSPTPSTPSRRRQSVSRSRAFLRTSWWKSSKRRLRTSSRSSTSASTAYVSRLSRGVRWLTRSHADLPRLRGSRTRYR